MLEPITQAPRYRLVADRLAALIDTGELKAGSKMPTDKVLVDQLGVSRATIREALIALEIMGYVETRFGAGAYVTNARPDALAAAKQTTGPENTETGLFEMLEARSVVEGEVAALAAERITAAQLDQLWECTQAMETCAADEIWNAEADESFHALVAEASQNAALRDLVSQIWRQQQALDMWQHIGDYIDGANLRPGIVAEHEEIIEALTAGDPDQARNAMRSHLESFKTTLLDGWKEPSA